MQAVIYFFYPVAGQSVVERIIKSFTVLLYVGSKHFFPLTLIKFEQMLREKVGRANYLLYWLYVFVHWSCSFEARICFAQGLLTCSVSDGRQE